jgi:hypothetical protein
MGCADMHYDLEAPRYGLFENIGVFLRSIGGINGDRWIASPYVNSVPLQQVYKRRPSLVNRPVRYEKSCNMDVMI